MTPNEFQNLQPGVPVLVLGWGPKPSFTGKVTDMHRELPYDYVEVTEENGKKWRLDYEKVTLLPLELQRAVDAAKDCVNSLHLCTGNFPVLDAYSSTAAIVKFLYDLGHTTIAEEYNKIQLKVVYQRNANDK